MADIDGISTILQELSLSDNKKDQLLQLENVLSKHKGLDLTEFSRKWPITSLIICLESKNRDICELSHNLLNIIFSSINIQFLLDIINNEYGKTKKFNSDNLKRLYLNQLKRVNNLDQWRSHPVLMTLVFDLIRDPETDIGILSTDNLKKIATLDNGMSYLFDGENRLIIENLIEKNDTISFRVLEAGVDISLLSQSASDKVEFLLQKILQILFTSDDELSRMNALELIGKLSATPQGASFIERNKVSEQLEKILLNQEFLMFLRPAIIKAFGNIFFNVPSLLTFNTCNLLERELRESENLDLLVIETICHISTNPFGKEKLYYNDHLMQEVCKKISNLVENSPSPIRIRCLDCTSKLLEFKPDWKSEYLNYNERFGFSLGSKKFFELVFKIAHQPFDDLHVAALRVLRSIADQPWGQKFLSELPVFQEWLLDRSTEACKEGKETKYDIIHILLHSKELNQYFESPYILKLKTFYKEGPFFVQPQSEVALND